MLYVTKTKLDDTEPTELRKVLLRAAYDRNNAEDRSPYDKVAIRTAGELLWLMRQHNWSGELDLPEGQERANLRMVNMHEVNICGIKLKEADLSAADLREVDLSAADLREANLRAIDLSGANLSGANLSGTDLSGADLSGAELGNIFLENTILDNADLRDARMDSETILSNAYLVQLDCRYAPRLSSEDELGNDSTRRGRARTYRNITRAYRALANDLRQKGFLTLAAGYRIRGERFERKELFVRRKFIAWLGSLLLDVLSGYGERPKKTFGAYIVVVSSFSALYFLVTHTIESKPTPLSWDEAIVFSLTSFHGRGFFPSSLPIGIWMARLSVVEAMIGLFIELIFIATFSRRFLQN